MPKLSLPNLLTAGNLICGISAIVISFRADWTLACFFIMASVFFDTLDGWVARRMRQETNFGAFFDSFADFISFGVAPVFVFRALESPLKTWVVLGLVCYVLASAFRLIRFHAQSRPARHGAFQGLPTTASAFIFVISLWLAPSAWSPWILSFLMISRMPFIRPFA